MVVGLKAEGKGARKEKEVKGLQGKRMDEEEEEDANKGKQL